MNRTFAVLALILAASPLAAGTDPSSGAPPEIPKAKRTTLGLYLTAREAYDKWKADPARVKILDVRTPEEYLFVGHAEAAWNVPLLLQTYDWDASGRNLAMTPNPDFLERVQALFAPSDTLLVICRSGGRSARAVDRIAAAGFRQVYSVVDGMEGETIDDPASPLAEQRLRGWKNSGLPWTHDLDPAKMSLPTARPHPAP
ncbi:MAG TPA: rhodanese-like domain-containing protein [Candidatus Polarisedimenticolia bacterium]|nr:rhodanese-like domain-containing protein [Candidatus Polarisedimenticolia bacterium]